MRAHILRYIQRQRPAWRGACELFGDSSGSALDVALAELQLNPREVMCKISLFCMHNYRILWRREQVSCRKSYTLRFRLLTVLLTFNWCSSEDLWLEG